MAHSNTIYNFSGIPTRPEAAEGDQPRGAEGDVEQGGTAVVEMWAENHGEATPPAS